MAIDRKRLLLRIVLPLVLVAALGWIVYGLTRPVANVARVKSGMAANAVSGSVVVQAEYGSEIRSEIGGRVIDSRLVIDRRVNPGDLLLQLDTGDLVLEIDRTRAELEATRRRIQVGSRAALDLEAAREALATAELQAQRGGLSEADLNAQRRRAKAAEQALANEKINDDLALESLRNSLESKLRQKDKMTITAPFEGIISRVDVRKGDLIGSGVSIARLISTGRRIEARISQENIAGVKPGLKAIVQFLPYDIQQFDARVTQVLSTADPDTQRTVAYLEVDIDPAKVVPGITGEVSIILDEHPAKANIPRRALFGERQVLVVREGRLELRKVRTGFTSLTAVEVLEGLTEGEWVVVDGQDQLRPGQRVGLAPVADTRWN